MAVILQVGACSAASAYLAAEGIWRIYDTRIQKARNSYNEAMQKLQESFCEKFLPNKLSSSVDWSRRGLWDTERVCPHTDNLCTEDAECSQLRGRIRQLGLDYIGTIRSLSDLSKHLKIALVIATLATCGFNYLLLPLGTSLAVRAGLSVITGPIAFFGAACATLSRANFSCGGE